VKSARGTPTGRSPSPLNSAAMTVPLFTKNNS
jgi:hypothetical protein